MTPEQRAAADNKAQALAAQPRTFTLKLTAIGSSAGVVLPQELVAHLGIKEGDEVYAVETAAGIILTALEPRVLEQVEIGDAFMERYGETFAKLGK